MTPKVDNGGMNTNDEREATMAYKVKTYEEGFTYGAKCARTMSAERRADNVRIVKESEYAKPLSPTHDYWRGFMDAMRSAV